MRLFSYNFFTFIGYASQAKIHGCKIHQQKIYNLSVNLFTYFQNDEIEPLFPF